MERARLSQLLMDPSQIREDDMPALRSLLEQHPYFHSARLLHLKGLHQQGSVYFDEEARTTAAHVPDRHVIYELTVKKALRKTVLAVEAEIEGIPQDPAILPDAEKEKDLEQLEQLIVSEAMDSSFSLAPLDPPKEIQLVEVEIADPFEGSQERSFMEWVSGEPDKATDAPGKEDLIDTFLDTSSPAGTATPFFSAADMGKLSLVEDMSFVTETLAKIYEQQGHIDKAIKAYQHLSFKEPQKSSYFAARLKELEEKRQNK